MSKGFDYERSLCHRLSRWWMDDPNYDDIVFWRTPCSGGQATARAKKGLITSGRHGDMAAIDERGKALTKMFILEAKRGYNRDTIHDLLDRPTKVKEQKYEEWLRKLTEKCTTLGIPYWLLIHKRDRREEMVYMPSDAAGEFDDYAVFWDAPIHLKLTIAGNQMQIVGHPLSWFLEKVKRQDIEKLTGTKKE